MHVGVQDCLTCQVMESPQKSQTGNVVYETCASHWWNLSFWGRSLKTQKNPKKKKKRKGLDFRHLENLIQSPSRQVPTKQRADYFTLPDKLDPANHQLLLNFCNIYKNKYIHIYTRTYMYVFFQKKQIQIVGSSYSHKYTLLFNN